MDICENSFVFNEFNEKNIDLTKLPIGKAGKVKALLNTGLQKRRLLDLGLTPNTIVTTERKSPSGNPIAYNIRGAVIALRKEEAKNVIIDVI